jgi:hypothetical protein
VVVGGHAIVVCARFVVYSFAMRLGSLVCVGMFACSHEGKLHEPSAPVAAHQPAETGTTAAEPQPPPAVLSGEAHLDCTISSKSNGHQKLVLAGGQGLEFDITVSPIVDGVVDTAGPDRGGSYRFTSHLAAAGSGELSGVGAVQFDELDTKVNVAMKRYKQPKGAGTELTFSSEDMASRGIYVEFAGKAHAKTGERYAVRVTLGQPGSGSGGSVTPATDAAHAPIQAKAVIIRAPMTTVVTTTTVQKLP